MSRILVCKDDEDLVLKKSRAFKYKEVNFSGVQCSSAFHIEDGDNSLTAVTDELDTSEEPIYSIITDEFGLYAMSQGVSAKLKISFCDNGKMIVDVLEGGILIKPDRDILLASRGVESMPAVKADGIRWVNASDILSFKEFWGSMKDKYIQDFEYVFVVKGEMRNGLSSLSIRIETDETIDISGGKIATLEAQLQLKDEAKQAKNTFKDLVSNTSGSGYDFDDEDDEEDSEEDQNDDDDFDDGSSY